MEEADKKIVDPLEAETVNLYFQRIVAAVIRKVGKVVTKFGKSPFTKDILVKHIQAQLNTELKLILDLNTRWISFLEMIKMFVKVEKRIRKALDKSGTSVTITLGETEILRGLVDVLKPVKHAVDGLCRTNATLLKAKRILNCVLKTLCNSISASSASLKTCLEIRIKEGRHTLYILLTYLNICKIPIFRRKTSMMLLANTETKPRCTLLLKP